MPSTARRIRSFVARGAQLRLEIGPSGASQMAGVVSTGTRIEQHDA